jgi:molecular chaperone DnaK
MNQDSASSHGVKPTVPSLNNEVIVGIDLGTTNSLVAWCDHTGPRIIPGPQGQRMLPSVVRYSADAGTPTVQAIGQPAKDHAQEFPAQTIYSVKRLMGREVKDVAPELKYLSYAVVEGPHRTARVKIASHVISPQEVSAQILKELKTWADAYFGRPVKKAVITVPAYFDDSQRQATRDAGRIAGLQVVRIVNEPTAASLAYNLGLKAAAKPALAKKPQAPGQGLKVSLPMPKCSTSEDPATSGQEAPSQDATIAVYDLGGGTFDVSILRLQKTPTGVVDQVLATAGDTHLGGDDVDQMLLETLLQELSQAGVDVTHPGLRQAVRAGAEKLKIALSEFDDASVLITPTLGQLQATVHAPARTAPAPASGQVAKVITRIQLEAMIQPWIARTIDACKTAIAGAKLALQDISRVVMVGGSTRIPAVQKRVAEFFGTEPYTAINPDEVVALGAAVQASILAGYNRDMLLLDVIPLSLGIETMGGAVAKLITANTTIPARASERFSTYVDGQTSVRIHVLQGERELVKDCRSLGQFDLRGIPPMPAGLPKLEVTFLVDANGILTVTAVEKRSEKSARIQIVPNHGLTREEVSRMERESLENAVADMTQHRLIDLRNQARLDTRAIDRQLAKVGDELEPEYRNQIMEKVARVKAFADAPDPDANAFHHALDDMDKTTVRLAEIAIRKTLRDEGLSK